MVKHRTAIVCGFLSVALLISNTSSAYAGEVAGLSGYTSESDYHVIADIDDKLLKKEIELLELNNDFRHHYLKPLESKGRRLAVYDVAGGALANAGEYGIIHNFWRYWKRPAEGLARRGKLEGGVITVMVAYLTLGGLYAMDGAHDLLSDYRSSRRGYGARSMLKRAVELKAELDKLLQDRNAALARLSDEPSGQREVLTLQGRVLKHSRDLALLEFSRIFIHSRKQHTARDINTIGHLAVCATGAFPGSCAVLHGLEETNLKVVGGGGIGFLISGCTLVAAPLLIHGGALANSKWNKHKLAKMIGDAECKTAEGLNKDVISLENLLATAGSSTEANKISQNVARYKTVVALMQDRQSALDKQDRKERTAMFKDFIMYGAEGGPQIAWGALLMRAGYKYTRDPVRAFRSVAQGATVNEVSWGIWLGESSLRMANTQFAHWKDRKQVSDQPFNSSNEKMTALKSLQ